MIGLLMLATAFAAPQSIHPEHWLNNDDDTPAVAWGKAARAAQRVAIVVDPKGKATACEPLMGRNEGNFDWPVCERLVKRSRFEPATENGRPTWGVWTMTINFAMGMERIQNAVAYDIVVPVNHLPGSGEPQGVKIQQLVDEAGKVEACTVIEPSREPALNALACKVATVLPIAHVKDHAGAPVRSVVIQTVVFAVDPAGTRRN
jgi:hypothetical protein